MRDFRNPRYKVLRDREECIECDLCVRQCANEVHYRDEKTGALRADSMKCVNCQRCTLLCPTRALAITRWPQVDAGSAVWTEGAMDDITAQAQTGGVLLASMGNPKSYHIYWEHLLLNASQVTNPSIDPLREPMETRVVLGSRPSKLRVNERTRTVVSPLPPQLSLDVPIMFSAMSFGSVSLNTQKALAMAARELGTYFNCGEGGLHRDLEPYADRAIVQVASGRFGVDPHYLNAGAAIEIKIGQGAKPGIGGHLPGEKIKDVYKRQFKGRATRHISGRRLTNPRSEHRTCRSTFTADILAPPPGGCGQLFGQRPTPPAPTASCDCLSYHIDTLRKQFK